MEEKIPLVSVIIPMYNAEKFIPQTLESLLYQTMISIRLRMKMMTWKSSGLFASSSCRAQSICRKGISPRLRGV